MATGPPSGSLKPPDRHHLKDQGNTKKHQQESNSNSSPNSSNLQNTGAVTAHTSHSQETNVTSNLGGALIRAERDVSLESQPNDLPILQRSAITIVLVERDGRVVFVEIASQTPEMRFQNYATNGEIRPTNPSGVYSGSLDAPLGSSANREDSPAVGGVSTAVGNHIPVVFEANDRRYYVLQGEGNSSSLKHLFNYSPRESNFTITVPQSNLAGVVSPMKGTEINCQEGYSEVARVDQFQKPAFKLVPDVQLRDYAQKVETQDTEMVTRVLVDVQTNCSQGQEVIRDKITQKSTYVPPKSSNLVTASPNQEAAGAQVTGNTPDQVQSTSTIHSTVLCKQPQLTESTNNPPRNQQSKDGTTVQQASKNVKQDEFVRLVLRT